ncbi:NACHT domain-containing protein [Xanthomarina sp. F2636L]|uniref:NACHT domain-containing protein n=1 Tax=Xanthomarina sp. F2636L TaxID=2996018 RepID=UPI00225E4C64|nr:hypothetical protein [Xanthomarina sp. F2636L]MCX7551545.1 hypothetical protein [Xanthomarina sp. F2636L]
MPNFITNLFSTKKINVQNVKNSNVTVFNFENVNLKSKEDLQILHSQSEIEKIDLTAKDFQKLIGDIKNEKGIIQREIFSSDKSQNNLISAFLGNTVLDDTLEKCVKIENKIILLGNPGLGKTTELKRLAINILNDSDNKLIPIYRNLKNFTSSDNIESLLFQNWKSYKNLLFIFDGIDEIQNIQYFNSKLETFIYYLNTNEVEFKFILSCRTNVYESLIKNISDFKVYYLRDLYYNESINLLKLKCGTAIIDSLTFDSTITEFLKNPFQVNILADYIKENKKLPSNSSELWESYISIRLTHDDNHKLVKKDLNVPLIKRLSIKTSLVNELMQRNTISNDELYEVASSNSSDFKDFKNNPLIDKNKESNEWFFEHRNIQEYFAATAISGRDIHEILEFIQINELGKTHPSLFNTITFLINLLDNNSDTYKGLVNWLIDNEPELLFKADYNRIDLETKIKVFQTHFNNECVEKTLWINTNRTFEIKEIAQFANCSENYEYLLNILSKSSDYHIRTTNSAISILSFFDIPEDSLSNLKELLFEKLNDEDLHISIKSELLYLIKNQNLTNDDEAYLKSIFEVFKNETHKALNNNLLLLLSEKDDIDSFFAYIKEEFLRAHKLKERLIPDETIRGNEILINSLILNLTSADNFLELAKYFFNDNSSLYKYDDYLNKLTSKLLDFIKQDPEFIDKILDSVIDDVSYHIHDKLLSELIVKSNSRDRAIIHLLKNQDFEKVDYFIAGIISESELNAVVNILIEKEISVERIERFRNFIANLNIRRLGMKFERLMKRKGIKFKEPLLTETKAKRNKRKYEKGLQDNLNILFSKRRLLKRIKKFFRKNKAEIKQNELHDITMDWYKENGHGNVMETSLSLIQTLLYQYTNGPISYDIVKKYLENDYLIYNKIKTILEEYKKSNRPFKVSKKQIKTIEEWCLLKCSQIDFDNIVTIPQPNTFRYNQNYKIFELIFFFQKEFEFSLPQNFLVNCIQYYEFDRSSEVDESFLRLKDLINNETLFNERIIHNINNETLVGLAISKHMEYALNNNLEDAFPQIRNLFMNHESIYNDSRKIEKYIEITGDKDLLLDSCKAFEGHKFWSIIRIMIDMELFPEYCKKTSLDYLETGDDTHRLDALNVLFELNDPIAIKYLISFLEDNTIVSLMNVKLLNYSSISDFSILETLFKLIYDDKILDDFESSRYREFIMNYISNISRSKDGFDNVNLILNKRKEKLANKGEDLFYINLLIDKSENSYINSNSKPYLFEEALLEADKLLAL